jgi:hypothetical protein
MSRREEREARQARVAEDVMLGVFANWGIWPDDHTPEAMGHADLGEGFAAQVGPDEAVEWNEVYTLIREVAMEAYERARNDGARSGAEDDYLTAVTEVVRLRGIIAAAYGSQAWDIGSLKGALWPGLTGPLLPTILNAQPRKPEPVPAPVAPALVFGAAEYEVGFDETSDRDSWWITLSLMGDHGERGTYTMTDIEGITLIQRLQDQVTEGRKRFNE